MLLAAHLTERGHARVLGLACSVVGGTLTVGRLVVLEPPAPGWLPAQLISDEKNRKDIRLKWPEEITEGDHHDPVVLEIEETHED